MRVLHGAAGAALLLPALAVAQQAAPSATSTAPLDLGDVFRRLDTTALLLVSLAALVLVVFVWRVVSMVRGDRVPSSSAANRRKPVARGADLTADTGLRELGASTDWGPDQNKRGSVTRVMMPGDTALDTSTRLPDTVFPVVGDRVVIPDDALGRSPVPNTSPYRTGTNPYYLRGELAENQIDVVEVADVLTQAELLVQLGDPKEAMNLLSRHIRETEKPGPQVWLMLLDLYRSTGREAQYNALSDGFRALFNAAVPPWVATTGADRALEDYPQVLQRTVLGWPTPECRAYLEALLNDDRGGSRQGFSLPAYRDILFLVDVLEARDVIEREEGERQTIALKLS